MTDPKDNRPAPDPLFAMGVIFMGAGVALMVAVGPGMVGLLALGVVFMLSGANRMRERSKDE